MKGSVKARDKGLRFTGSLLNDLNIELLLGLPLDSGVQGLGPSATGTLQAARSPGIWWWFYPMCHSAGPRTSMQGIERCMFLFIHCNT